MVFLAGPGAAYVNGQVLVVDGGNTVAEERVPAEATPSPASGLPATRTSSSGQAIAHLTLSRRPARAFRRRTPAQQRRLLPPVERMPCDRPPASRARQPWSAPCGWTDQPLPRLLDSGGDPSRAAPGAQHRAAPRLGHLAGRAVGLRARRLPPHLARGGRAARGRAVPHQRRPARDVHRRAAVRLRGDADPGRRAARPVRLQAADVHRPHADDGGPVLVRVRRVVPGRASPRASCSAPATR